MTSQGRQYPDVPLEPPPDAEFAPLPGLEGWPDNSLNFWPEAARAFLDSIAEPESGPPWTHTFTLPEPEYDDEGSEVWREPDPSYTIGEFRPPGPRIEITAEFCQCPACREARQEPPAPAEVSLAAFDRLVDMIASEPLNVDPLCNCPACCEARAGRVPPESGDEG